MGRITIKDNLAAYEVGEKIGVALVDKLLIHLAQSKLYMKGRKLEDTLSWRAKEGGVTKEDMKSIKWAIDFLTNNPLYIKE